MYRVRTLRIEGTEKKYSELHAPFYFATNYHPLPIGWKSYMHSLTDNIHTTNKQTNTAIPSTVNASVQPSYPGPVIVAETNKK